MALFLSPHLKQRATHSPFVTVICRSSGFAKVGITFPELPKTWKKTCDSSSAFLFSFAFEKQTCDIFFKYRIRKSADSFFLVPENGFNRTESIDFDLEEEILEIQY